MSQILDAINKAESERRHRAEQTSEMDKGQLYKKITQQQQTHTKHSKQRLLLLSLLFAGGVAFWFYQQQSSPLSQVTHETAISVDSPEPMKNSTADTAINHQTMPAVKQAATVTPKKNITAQAQANKQVNTETDQPATVVKTEKKPTAELIPLTHIEQPEKSNNKKPPLAALKPIAKKAKPKASTSKPQSLVTAKKPTNPVQQKSPPKTTTASKKKPQSALKKGFNITAIVYDENPSARLILVNGGVVREGGVIPNSTTKVVSILKKGVVINDGNGEVLIGTR